MADILIRGMEMPKNCEDCRLSYSDEYGTTICAACDDCAYSVSCPLLPLPEGHGRLIDADACHSPEDLNNEPTIVPAEGGGEK